MFSINAKTNGQRNCTTAILRVETNLSCELSAFHFTFETGQQYSTSLLVDCIREEMENGLKEIRRFAYEEGRKDMKARRKRKRTFASHWNPDCVGY